MPTMKKTPASPVKKGATGTTGSGMFKRDLTVLSVERRKGQQVGVVLSSPAHGKGKSTVQVVPVRQLADQLGKKK